MYREIRISEFLHRKKELVKIDPEQEYRLVTVKLHHKGVVLRELKKGSLIGSNMYRLSKGQFILSGIDARNGAFGIVPDELDGAIVTNDFWYFDIDETKVKRDFFFWLTNTPLFLDSCIKSSKGETQRVRLQKDLFLNFEFHFPPIEVQETFLKGLHKKDSLLNLLNEEHGKQADYLVRLRQTILQEAIEGKLTAEWRTKNPVRNGDPNADAAALLAKIKAEKQKLIAEGKIKKEKPLAPIKPEEIPFDLPEGWVWCRLGELGFVNPRNYVDDDIDAGFSPMPLISEKYGIEAKYEIRKWRDIKNGFTHFANNDVAIAKITPCFENAKACVFRNLPNACGAGTTELHILRPVIATPHYIYIFLKTSRFLEEGKKLMTGAVGQKRVPAEYFSNAHLPLPPLAEQKAIVSCVDRLLAMVDELEKQVTERKAQAEALMQAVLCEAFEKK